MDFQLFVLALMVGPVVFLIWQGGGTQRHKPLVYGGFFRLVLLAPLVLLGMSLGLSTLLSFYQGSFEALSDMLGVSWAWGVPYLFLNGALGVAAFLSWMVRARRLAEKRVLVGGPERRTWVNHGAMALHWACVVALSGAAAPLFLVLAVGALLLELVVVVEVGKGAERAARLQQLASAAVVLGVSAVASQLLGYEALAAALEWVLLYVFLASRYVSGLWHLGGAKLYVGRDVALGVATKCIECKESFSVHATRETCADCRDEVCSSCGDEVSLRDDLGALVAVNCFFCNTCLGLLKEEASQATSKRVPRAGSGGRSGGGATISSVPTHKSTAAATVTISPRPNKYGALSSRSTKLSPRAAKSLPDAERPSKSWDGADQVCRLFQRGECTYGDACKYIHVESEGGAPTGGRPRAASDTTVKKRRRRGRKKKSPINSMELSRGSLPQQQKPSVQRRAISADYASIVSGSHLRKGET